MKNTAHCWYVSPLFFAVIKKPARCQTKNSTGIVPSSLGVFCSWLKCQWLSHACSRPSLVQALPGINWKFRRKTPCVTYFFPSFSLIPLKNHSIPFPKRDTDHQASPGFLTKFRETNLRPAFVNHSPIRYSTCYSNSSTTWKLHAHPH